MELRDFVTFDAAFIDDGQWDEHGNTMVPAGYSISIALTRALAMSHIHCTTPAQHSFYGWSFTASTHEEHIWCLLQPGDDWLVILKDVNTPSQDVQGERPTDNIAWLQRALHDVLIGDSRFARVQWYTRAEYEKGDCGRANATPF